MLRSMLVHVHSVSASTHTVTLNDCAFLSIQWLELANWTQFVECGDTMIRWLKDFSISTAASQKH